MDDLWRQYALDPPRGSGSSLGGGVLRAEPEDFVVEEELGFAPAGAGQHVLLKVRKRDANTQWVARELARIARCRPPDVGFAGLKDRRAVAEQWFTVPKSAVSLDEWARVRDRDFEILEAHAHARKLPRGALAGNRFSIRVREIGVDDAELAGRMARIASRGVPNYFGPQRFGRDGANLLRIQEELRSLRPAERGFVLSAARSLIFNGVLGTRVRDGSWERFEEGDLANLDGRGSFFPVGEIDDTLRWRGEQLDIHPTGPLWGRGEPPSAGRVSEIERRIARELVPAARLIEEAGMEQERRSLRLAVRELSWERQSTSLLIRFRLARGSYATTVLRELFDFAAPGGEQEE